MASPLTPEVFTTVDASTGDLEHFVGISKSLVEGYVNNATIDNAIVTPIHCNDRGNVNKVFSQSVRAFLKAVGLEYRAENAVAAPPKHFPRVSTDNNDLSKYPALSQNVVVLYNKVASHSNDVTIDVTCNDLEEVNKVFSQSARAFLAWENLVYTDAEPVNQ